MSLFDSTKDNFYVCGMDHLYNLALFCKRIFSHEMKVMVHGVTRKGMRGIPTSVKQEGVKNGKQQLEVWGTVKAAMLRGDKDWPSLVASSVYDTKPVHFLIMVGQQLKWIVKEKPVFNVEMGRVESMRF